MAKRYGEIKRDRYKVRRAKDHLRQHLRKLTMKVSVSRDTGGRFFAAACWGKRAERCGYSAGGTPTAAIKAAVSKLIQKTR